MDVDVPMNLQEDATEPGGEQTMVPMSESGGIEALREKLHARMAQLRRGPKVGGDGEAGSRDELLEERRRQRAAMRERRRKETKEKIRREEEMKGKKAKDKEQSRDKGPSTKVCTSREQSSNRVLIVCRPSYLYRTRAPHPKLGRKIPRPSTQASRSPLSRALPVAARKRRISRLPLTRHRRSSSSPRASRR